MDAMAITSPADRWRPRRDSCISTFPTGAPGPGAACGDGSMGDKRFWLRSHVATPGSVLFGLRYNDVTNAFKLYRRHVIAGVQPFLSHHFNLTVELPLKAIVRGYNFEVVPNSYINRTAETAKFKIKEIETEELKLFGSFPGMDDPNAPKPPVQAGKPWFNPFTGIWGDGGLKGQISVLEPVQDEF